MTQRAAAVGALLLAIIAACIPMWWIFATLQLVVALAITVLVGSAIAWLGAARRWSALSVLLAGLGSFALLVVPLVAPHRIPRGEWLPALGEAGAAVVLSWRRLLTIGLPVGTSDALLVAPVLLVLAGSLIGVSLALRSRRAETAALVPAAIALWSVLWGSRDLPFPWLTGLAVLVPTAVYVTVVRQARRRSRAPRALSSFARRIGAGLAVGLLAVAAGGAAGAFAPLPDRTVLRGDSPASVDFLGASPLASYRSYWRDPTRTATQLTVTGMEPGDRIRLAVLDQYDGEVLSAGDGQFTRVPSAEPGEGRSIGVTVGALATPWLPTVGSASEIRFVGDRSERLARGLHRSDALDTLVVEGGLAEGDGYQLRASEQVPVVTTDALAGLVPEEPRQGSQELPDSMLSALAAWTGQSSVPGERLEAMVEGLRADGFVSHGLAADDAPSRPGHSLERLEALFEEPMIGDAEQYATAAMLLARQVGFDARVVVGFTPQEIVADRPTAVLGSDADAWLEVRTRQGWVAIDVTPEPRPIPEQNEGAPTIVEEPPLQQAPAPAPGGQADRGQPAAPSAPRDFDDSAERFLQVLVAAGAVVGLFALIASIPIVLVLAKIVRRRHRRRADTPRERAVGAWAELVDGLRDRGEQPPETGTRLEQAGDDPVMVRMAHSVDKAVFAAAEPSEPELDEVWTLGDEVLAGRDSTGGWRRRWMARFNPASFVQR